MLRITLGVEDMARVRLIPTYGPLAETCFSFSTLHGCRPGALYAGCRGTGPGTRPLIRTVARLFQFPAIMDIITIAGQAPTMEHGMDAVLGAPPAVIAAELAGIAAWYGSGNVRRWPSWVSSLPGDRRARCELASVLRECYETAVEPHWPRIRAHLDAELATRLRGLAEGGLDRLLGSLHPRLRWRSPVLEMLDGPGTAREMTLHGRGITLVPTVFSQKVCALHSLSEPDTPLIIFFPALRDLTGARLLWRPADSTARSGALAALLGDTRAAALEAVAEGCTTTELARRIHVSPATASHHAAILRSSGLITTRRIGSAVLHTLTGMGAEILSPPSGEPAPLPRSASSCRAAGR